MNKQTKMIVGVGVVALAAYLIYQQNQKKATTTASFSGVVGPRMMNAAGSPNRVIPQCCGHIGAKGSDGYYTCCNGTDISQRSAGCACEKCPAGCKSSPKGATTVTPAETGGFF